MSLSTTEIADWSQLCAGHEMRKGLTHRGAGGLWETYSESLDSKWRTVWVEKCTLGTALPRSSLKEQNFI